jgi:hypothetical protein
VKAKKKKAPAEPGRDRLLKELRTAEEGLDEQGLLFLLRQAQVLIYNAHVDRINETTEEPAQASPAEPEGVRIEKSADGKAIFLVIGRTRKILAPEEMRRLVRICYAAETRTEALQHLFTVLVKERRDILADAFIGSPDNPLLGMLFTTIRETYKLEDR